MVLINLHRNLHEKSSFLSEIMFIRINPYLCHLLTRYQSTIFPNHKSCVRKKGVPDEAPSFYLYRYRKLKLNFILSPVFYGTKINCLLFLGIRYSYGCKIYNIPDTTIHRKNMDRFFHAQEYRTDDFMIP